MIEPSSVGSDIQATKKAVRGAEIEFIFFRRSLKPFFSIMCCSVKAPLLCNLSAFQSGLTAFPFSGLTRMYMSGTVSCPLLT